MSRYATAITPNHIELSRNKTDAGFSVHTRSDETEYNFLTGNTGSIDKRQLRVNLTIP